MTDILNERTCLCYFVQFLEARNALSLIKFWIDAESFRAAAELCSHNGNVPKSKSLALKRSCSTDGYDSLSCRSQSMESIDDSLSVVSEETPDPDTMSQKSSTQFQLQSSIVADAMRIYRRYIVTTSMNSVDIPATVQSSISLALCDKDEVSSKLFVQAQEYVFEQLERDYLESYLESVFYCKYTVDVLTSDDLNLTDILHNESILFYFMEFLEQEHSQQYLEFWMTAVHFRRNLMTHEYNKEQAQSDALVLYEKYFSLQATNPLPLSDTVRSIVEGGICQESDPICSCFDLPIRIVEFFLEHNYFKPFLKSNLFFKYLSELFSKINEGKMNLRTESTHKKTHKRNNSEPIALKPNTLLATMDRRSTKNPTAKNNMQIDSQQLTDPDILWRRTPLQRGLSFGRVDAYGRYQREFDLEPIHDDKLTTTTSSRIKKVVRKLVNLPEDKVQEEIAWQVAEMIVKDVTNVTLNGTTMQHLTDSTNEKNT